MVKTPRLKGKGEGEFGLTKKKRRPLLSKSSGLFSTYSGSKSKRYLRWHRQSAPRRIKIRLRRLCLAALISSLI